MIRCLGQALNRRREGGRASESERERERERERDSNSKTLFYKDCSLGSVKNLTTSPRETDRQSSYR